MYKCTNCSWVGDNPFEDKFCLVCGDNVIKEESKIVKPIEKVTIKKTTKKKTTRKYK